MLLSNPSRYPQPTAIVLFYLCKKTVDSYCDFYGHFLTLLLAKNTKIPMCLGFLGIIVTKFFGLRIIQRRSAVTVAPAAAGLLQ